MVTSSENKRILVLGANGQVGRQVFNALARSFPQAEILGAVRAPHFHFEGVGAGKHRYSIVFDINKEVWSGGTVDVVINCIGAIDASPRQLFDVHVNTTMAILRNRAAMGTPGIIQVSALGADSKSSSAFLCSKAMADAALLTQQHTWVIRPSIVCTPDTVLVQRIRQLRRVLAITGRRLWLPEALLETKVQPILPNDLCAIITEIINERPQERIINAVGADVFTFRQLFEQSGITVFQAPESLFRLGLKVFRPLLLQFINREELLLMGQNNTAPQTRGAASTKDFWREQLSPNYQPRVDFSTVFA